MVLIVGMAAVVVVLVGAAVLLLTRHPAPTSHSPRPSSSSGSPGSSSAPAGLVALQHLLPSDTISSSCTKGTQYRSVSGVTSNYTCDTSGPDNVGFTGLQFRDTAAYKRGLTLLDHGLGFSASGAGSSCPPSGTAAQTSWHSPSHPAQPGQLLQCVTAQGLPVYLWTLPADRAIFLASGYREATSFAHLEHWWQAYG